MYVRSVPSTSFLQFSTVEKLVDHLALDHDKPEYRFEKCHFETRDEFEGWKSELEDNSMANFVRLAVATRSADQKLESMSPNCVFAVLKNLLIMLLYV